MPFVLYYPRKFICITTLTLIGVVRIKIQYRLLISMLGTWWIMLKEIAINLLAGRIEPIMKAWVKYKGYTRATLLRTSLTPEEVKARMAQYLDVSKPLTVFEGEVIYTQSHIFKGTVKDNEFYMITTNKQMIKGEIIPHTHNTYILFVYTSDTLIRSGLVLGVSSIIYWAIVIHSSYSLFFYIHIAYWILVLYYLFSRWFNEEDLDSIGSFWEKALLATPVNIAITRHILFNRIDQ